MYNTLYLLRHDPPGVLCMHDDRLTDPEDPPPHSGGYIRGACLHRRYGHRILK
jgi:hypothetical protein